MRTYQYTSRYFNNINDILMKKDIVVFNSFDKDFVSCNF